MSLGSCYKLGKTVGACEQTVRGQGGGESHRADKRKDGELRREPRGKTREGELPPDM